MYKDKPSLQNAAAKELLNWPLDANIALQKPVVESYLFFLLLILQWLLQCQKHFISCFLNWDKVWVKH